jgi:hypothetical protein
MAAQPFRRDQSRRPAADDRDGGKRCRIVHGEVIDRATAKDEPDVVDAHCQPSLERRTVRGQQSMVDLELPLLQQRTRGCK